MRTISLFFVILSALALTGCGAKLDVRDSAVSFQAVSISCDSAQQTLATMRATVYAEIQMGRQAEAQQALADYDHFRKKASETCKQLSTEIWDIVVPKKEDK